ncbi:response regulator [Mariniflexile jejuense]|uniref:Response regulator n=1 Tax=Mariniflexile jejuense TaxID=1173582 RepID=A0ABW3JLC6_9FLAO
MMNSYNVLLIDDDSTTNLLNEIHIKKAGIAKSITIADSALQALDIIFVEKKIPDLIFLDLNMPVMNGWQFLDEYCQRCTDTTKPIIIVLTASINPADKEMADNNSCVLDFVNKPLNKDKVKGIINKLENNIITN